MDPASAIIGIVSFGFTVFQKVNEVRKAIKTAPEKLRALQESCFAVELFLRRLQAVQDCPLSHVHSPDELAYLLLLCDRATRCLEEVNEALDQISVRRSSDGKTRRTNSNGSPKSRHSTQSIAIHRIRWIMRRDDFEDITCKVRELRDALGVVLEFVNS